VVPLASHFETDAVHEPKCSFVLLLLRCSVELRRRRNELQTRVAEQRRVVEADVREIGGEHPRMLLLSAAATIESEMGVRRHDEEEMEEMLQENTNIKTTRSK
jgi:hypothetical protein